MADKTWKDKGMIPNNEYGIFHISESGGSGWCWWDETGSVRYGPWDLYVGAQIALSEYESFLSYGAENPKTSIVNARIDSILRECNIRLQAANTKRGNAWEVIGLLGLFLEVRTMYLRLRGFVWNGLMPSIGAGKVENMVVPKGWKSKVENCLIDLIAYATLCMMALRDDNWTGVGDDSWLKAFHNSKKWPSRTSAEIEQERQGKK